MLKQWLPLVIASMAAVCTWPAVTPAADNAPRHVRAVWTRSPATDITISWTTSGAGSDHAVRLRREGEEEWIKIPSQRNEQYAARLDDRPAPYAHHARLAELEPATKYHVVCESDGERTREFYFTTAPDDDRPIALIFGGDSRSGIDARQQMNRMMARMVSEQAAAGRPPIVGLAHGGDFIVDGRRLDQWLQWLSDHELTTADDGRLLPVIPTRGNHDMGPLYDQVFDFPKGDGNYFALDLGTEVRLATLNTEISTAGDQRDWLARELAAERWRRRW